MTLPMDMKKLMEAGISEKSRRQDAYGVWEGKAERRQTYPNVAPEPSMYLPKVRMTPFGPAPYWKMETVPALVSAIVLSCA